MLAPLPREISISSSHPRLLSFNISSLGKPSLPRLGPPCSSFLASSLRIALTESYLMTKSAKLWKWLFTWVFLWWLALPVDCKNQEGCLVHHWHPIKCFLHSKLFFFFYILKHFIIILKKFLFLLYFTLQNCIGFAIHWHESATGVYEFRKLLISQ